MYFAQQLEELDQAIIHNRETCFVTDNSFIANAAKHIREQGEEYTASRESGLRMDVARTWHQQVMVDEQERLLRQQAHAFMKHNPKTNAHQLVNIQALLEKLAVQAKHLGDCAYFNLTLLRSLDGRVNTICHRTATSTTTVWTSVPVVSVSTTEPTGDDMVPLKPLKRTKRVWVLGDSW